MNYNTKSYTFSSEEVGILENVYGINDPVNVMTLDNDEEKESIIRILKVLREPEPVSLIEYEPDQYKTIEEIYAHGIQSVEIKGLQSLDFEEKIHYKMYLLHNCIKSNNKGVDTKVVQHHIAELVLLDNEIMRFNGYLYIYNGNLGVYTGDYEGTKIKTMIKSYINKDLIEDKLLTAIYNLVYNEETIRIDDSKINARPPHWIHFKNGYYDYMTDTMKPHNSKYYEMQVIPYEYDSIKYPGNFKWITKGNGVLKERISEPLLFDNWLKEVIPNLYDRLMLLQYIGYSMSLGTNEQKFLMICGSGGTGKSTLLSLIEEIIGLSNVSHISLQGLQGQFAGSELYLKQANICADIPLGALEEVDVIKKLTGEDTLTADRKYKAPISFKSYARLFFSANDIPINLSDKSNAFYRRMLILKMDRRPIDIDQELLEKLKIEIPNIISLIMEELYCNGGSIDVSGNSKRLVEEAHKNSDTVEAFIIDQCTIGDNIKVDRLELYSKYLNYCTGEDRRPLTRNKFYVSIRGKGFKEKRNNKGSSFLGIKINDGEPDCKIVTLP